VHWVVARTADGITVLNRKLDNSAPAIAELIWELEALRVHGAVTVGIDVLGGIAGLITAMLTSAGFRCVHVPGLAVNRARRGTRGGENKSDPRDARVIADQIGCVMTCESSSRPDQQGVLQAQTQRGEEPPPGRLRSGSTADQRPARHPAHPTTQRLRHAAAA
jgi:hypothetical protein